MTEGFMAVAGGLFLAVMALGGLGAPALNNRQDAAMPFSWSRWRAEAALSLWILNPVNIWRDVWEGYSDWFTGIIMTLATAITAGAVFVSAALLWWGVGHLIGF